MMLKVLLLFVALPAVAFCVNCKKEEDGIYDTGCKYYVMCKKGKGMEVYCKRNQAFNAKTQKCESANKVAPPCGTKGGIKKKDCSALEDGNYADTKFNCRAYYTCAGGRFITYNTCPSVLVFNDERQACDYPRDTKPPCGTMRPRKDSNESDRDDNDDDDDDN